MGSAEENRIAKAKSKTVFIEDLSQEELDNLANKRVNECLILYLKI